MLLFGKKVEDKVAEKPAIENPPKIISQGSGISDAKSLDLHDGLETLRKEEVLDKKSENRQTGEKIERKLASSGLDLEQNKQESFPSACLRESLQTGEESSGKLAPCHSESDDFFTEMPAKILGETSIQIDQKTGIHNSSEVVGKNQAYVGNKPGFPSENAGEEDGVTAETLQETMIEIYTWVLKYGCLSFCQLSSLYPQKILSKIVLPGTLSVREMDGEKLYFHNESSIEIYAGLASIPKREITGKVVLSDSIEAQNLPVVLQEIDTLLVLDKCAQASTNLRLYDWVSAINPRKKRMLKIKREEDKRGSLKPNFAIILQKNDRRCCILFHFMPIYQAFSPGERLAKCREILLAYNAWLSLQEEVENWLKKRRLFVPESSTAVALLFPSTQSEIVRDSLEICQENHIETPIYYAHRNEFQKSPFSCWHSCHVPSDERIFLKAKSERKRK